MTNTATRIAEIKARRDEMTQGDWWDESGVIHRDCTCPDGPHVCAVYGRDATVNIAFFLHSRSDIDWLVKEVERLEGRLHPKCTCPKCSGIPDPYPEEPTDD